VLITCLPICSAAQERDQDRDQSSFVGDGITVSGFPHDTPLSSRAGNRRILIDALGNLRCHFSTFRTLSWIERISFASLLACTGSVNHYRQAAANEQLARRYGFGTDNSIPMPPGEREWRLGTQMALQDCMDASQKMTCRRSARCFTNAVENIAVTLSDRP
jgi:hypothetical protein